MKIDGPSPQKYKLTTIKIPPAFDSKKNHSTLPYTNLTPHLTRFDLDVQKFETVATRTPYHYWRNSQKSMVDQEIKKDRPLSCLKAFHWAWFDQLGLSVKIFTIFKWLKHSIFLNTLNQIRIMGSWKGKCSFNGCIMSLWRLITICTPLYTRSLYSRYFSRSFSTYAQPLSFIFKSVSLSKREKKKNKKEFFEKMENKETEKQKYSGFDSIYNHLPHISSKFWTFFNF